MITIFQPIEKQPNKTTKNKNKTTKTETVDQTAPYTIPQDNMNYHSLQFYIVCPLPQTILSIDQK